MAIANGNKAPTVTIDGVEHKESDLTAEQRYNLAQIRDLEQKIFPMQMQVDQLMKSKEAFTAILIDSLKPKGDEEVVVEAEEEEN